MSEQKNVGGRPPKYKNKEEIQEKIDAYFKECEGRLLEDEDGHVMTTKSGAPIIIGQRPPTVTGLALALGFASRTSLMNYQAKKEFMDVIIRAKSKIEMYTEERLFDKDGANGAKFSLQNNFRGWNEGAKEAARAAVSAVKIINDIPRIAPAAPATPDDDADN